MRANGGSVPSTSSRNSSKMTVAYSTGWDEVFIHYQRADGCAFPALRCRALRCRGAADQSPLLFAHSLCAARHLESVPTAVHVAGLRAAVQSFTCMLLSSTHSHPSGCGLCKA